MSSARTVTSVPAVRYRTSGRGGRSNAGRELLIAGALFAAVVIAGTAFFYAFAPTIADLASLYISVT